MADTSLRALTARLAARFFGTTPEELPRAAQPVCCVGDIHGRMDLLDKMLRRIAQESASAQARIIFLGDMIDRGPQSAEVLRALFELQTKDPDRITCLMGNHERMMLDFITSPDTETTWLKAGGAATVRAFGLDPDTDAEPLADALAQALGPECLTWLSALPLSWVGDGLMAVHAAADPAAPPTQQTERSLLWGHPSFGKTARRDGVWVLCGHVIVPEPQAHTSRIALDTGAWRDGTLSAAWIDPEGLRFLQVHGPETAP